MKKFLAFAICLAILFCFTACDSAESDSSNSLVRALTGTDELTSITKFEIIHNYGDTLTEITDYSDLEFLKKYSYSHIHPSDKLHELFIFPKNLTMQCKLDGSDERTMYLMPDGSLGLIKTEVKDGVEVFLCEVYTAEEKYMLNTERLKTLLQKYGEKVD